MENTITREMEGKNMARATTKADLIESTSQNFDKLWGLIDELSEEKQNAAFDFGRDFLEKQKEAHWTRDKNLRDVLVHLYEWHKLLLDWVQANQKGEAKPFLPTPYNWKTYGQMNVGFWEKHQSTPYLQSKEMVKKSHLDVIALIEGFSNDELFAKKHFPWTGTSTLGSYCVSATSSHYDWAMKKVKRHLKTVK